jgi:UDP-N-acetyl-D-glucosamine dehydrogenase
MDSKAVCIIGLGYVGLPLACLCAEKGLKVKGLELDKGIVEKTNKGISHIKDQFVEEKIGKLKGKIQATTDSACIEEADIVIVCVPTPAKGTEPDLAPLTAACQTISKHLQKDQLVVIESTVYPGTTEEIVKPILEEGSSLKVGKDFFLGHCPERIDPGNKKFTIEKIPRVLACLSPKGTKEAEEFYSSIIDAEILVLGSMKNAEAVKVVENTFRDINIAFVNELAQSFDKMGINLSEVIKGASTKPFGYMPFYPGPGVGGHCIAQDPYYLISRAKSAGFEHRFLRLAREINKAMPAYIAGLAGQAVQSLGIPPEKAIVSVLGLAYKPGIDDTRESPALEIVELLKAKGFEVRAFDSFLPEQSDATSLEDALKGCSIVVLATHHSQFLEKLSPEFLKEVGVKAVVDSRNVLDKPGIEAKGILYKGVGR